MHYASPTDIALFEQGKRQYVKIEVVEEDGETTHTFTEADIVEGGMLIDRYSVTGTNLEFGTAIASELSLELLNTDGKFDDMYLKNALLTVYITLHDDRETAYYEQYGIFKVDSMNKRYSETSIKITALDLMLLFDVNVGVSYKEFYNTHEDVTITHTGAVYKRGTFAWLMYTICEIVGILPRDILQGGDLLDSFHRSWVECEIKDIPNMANLTYRALLGNLCALGSRFAYIDTLTGDSIVFGAHYGATDYDVTPSVRFDGSVDPDNYQKVDGACYTTAQGTKFYYPETIVTADKPNCILCTSLISFLNDEMRSNPLYQFSAMRARATRYVPFDATIMPAPFLEPGDRIKYYVNDSEFYECLITHVTYKLNGLTKISGNELINPEGSANIDNSWQSSRTGQSFSVLEERVKNLETSGGMYTYMIGCDGKTYRGIFKCIDGKPFYDYEEVTNE